MRHLILQIVVAAYLLSGVSSGDDSWSAADAALSGIWEVRYTAFGHDDVLEVLAFGRGTLSITTAESSKDDPRTRNDERLRNGTTGGSGVWTAEESEDGYWKLDMRYGPGPGGNPMFWKTHVLAKRIDETTLVVDYTSDRDRDAIKRGEPLPSRPGFRPNVLTYKLRP